jgi:hypothetical protein
MHGILVRVNPENTDETVSILQPSGQILLLQNLGLKTGVANGQPFPAKDKIQMRR